MITKTEFEKIHTELNKLMAKTIRINNQNDWVIAIVTSVTILAILFILKHYL